MRQIETWFANKRRRMKPLHDGSKSPEKAKTIVKCGKEGRFPKGAAEILRSYFDHGKLTRRTICVR